jgi:hypothetical protein
MIELKRICVLHFGYITPELKAQEFEERRYDEMKFSS